MLFDDCICGIKIRCDILCLGLGFGCSLFRCDGLCIDGLNGFIQIDSGCIGFVSCLLGCVGCGLCLICGCLGGFDCGIHFGLHILNLIGKIGSYLIRFSRCSTRSCFIGIDLFLKIGSYLIRFSRCSICGI